MFINASGEKRKMVMDLQLKRRREGKEATDEELRKIHSELEKAEGYAEIKKYIKFIVLRQEFLCPTFLPTIKESVLRDDFNFANYLGKCFYKTIGEVLGIRLTTLLTFVTFLFVYGLLRTFVPADYEIIVMSLFSILFFVVQFSLKVKTSNIFTELNHPLRSPYEF